MRTTAAAPAADIAPMDVAPLVAELLHSDVAVRSRAAAAARNLVGSPAFEAVIDGLVTSLHAPGGSRSTLAAASLALLGPAAIRPIVRRLDQKGSAFRDVALLTVLGSLSLQADAAMRSRIKLILRQQLFLDEDAPELVWRACSEALARVEFAEQQAGKLTR